MSELLPIVVAALLGMMASAVLMLVCMKRLRSALDSEIADRLSVEMRLAESEQRLRQIIATEPECVKVQSADGIISEMNPAGLYLVDADEPEDMVGTSVYRVVSPEFRDSYEEMTRRVFDGERVKLAFKIKSFKGRERWLETHAAPLKDRDGLVTALLGITRDISDLKRYEDEMRLHYRELSVASRLSSMGQMATALAHQLNQPLAAIANYSRGCLIRLEAGAPKAEIKVAMERVCGQAERAGEIIASIRRFLARDDPTYKSIDVRALVLDVLRIIGPEAQARDVKICTKGLIEVPPITGEAIQIEQVILNIVRNAIEAIEGADGAGERTVAISAEKAEAGKIRLHFRDHGPVAASVDGERMFEAFFTTKPSGMGMGLPISKSIVEAHGGQLLVRTNAPEPGHTFIMELPTGMGGSHAN
ncbi:two-component system, LuxR family, sensor kinase FixL [Hyphomicrobium sp. 1Nfss2.1]|uniref:sensor histidine kinase n=1 Tax=Hyphomicrobium sp. 1Nfss2.1 TaxID=3413936 RepID=UPI003C79D59F